MTLEQEIQQRAFRSENEKLLINILYTHAFIKTRMQETLKPEGITAQQYNILRILRGQHPEPCSIQSLKERMLDKECDASRLVDRLFLKELVSRRTCSDDKRRQDILITPAGLALLDRLDPKVSAMHQALQIDSEMAKNANQVLDQLRTELRKA